MWVKCLRRRPKPFHTSSMSKETPCIAVCMMDPRSSLCLGCGRTLPEIARWHRMDSAERHAVMAVLPARMADAGLEPIQAAAPKAG
jgi:predicted Fe-S protein YdhL (DUF1289 family)